MSLPAPEPKIGVVGAGLMGAEIALVFALGGMDVLLNDRDAAALEAGLARLRVHDANDRNSAKGTGRLPNREDAREFG